jgi:4-amino-4-deoxy-L-arabinose transferase-like glycosyltransferase
MSQVIEPEANIPAPTKPKSFDKALFFTFIRENHVFILMLLNIGLALFLRIYNLSTNPGGFDQDEAVNGVDAYSIGQTLRDHHGNFLPPMLESFEDWVSPVLTYITVPFVAILGLSEFSVRLPVALIGAGSVLLMYLFVKRLTRRKDLALLTSFFLCVMPWNIMSSRWAIPPGIVTFFLLLFLDVFYRATDAKPKLWKFGLVGLCAVVLTYSYPTQKMFVPMLLGVLCLTDLVRKTPWRALFSKYLAIGLPFLLLTSPIYLLTLLDPAKYNGRFIFVSIFQDGINPVTGFLQRYLSYILPNFYFEKDSGIISDHVPGIESTFNFLAPFYYMGIVLCLYSLFTKNLTKKPFIINKPAALLLLGWLVLFPIPASLTRDLYYILRVIHGVSLIIIFSVIGLGTLLDFVKSKKILRLIYIGIVAVSGFYLFNFSTKYFEEYPALSGEFYLYGTRQYSEYLLKNDAKFDSVKVDTMVNTPYIYYLFYSGKDPHQYNYAEINARDEKGGWLWVPKLDKYTFDSITPEDLKDTTEIYTVRDKADKVYYRIYARDKNWYVVRIH